jgi:putative transposase
VSIVGRLRGKASIERVCAFLGYSRQGYYKRLRLEAQRRQEEEGLRESVLRIRHRQPRVGGRKLYHLVHPARYGRDRFFEWLKANGLLVRRKRSGHRTTYAGRVRFGNQLKRSAEPQKVLVADITYLRTRHGFLYLFLVTHLASRKILGYRVCRTLEATGSVKALEHALKQIPCSVGMIHHSDRGYQYSSRALLALTQSRGMTMSMTEEDHVYENAVAERVNGILKDEFLLGAMLGSEEQAQRQVSEAIEIYNNERPHTSLRFATPSEKYTEMCQLF